MLIWGSVEPLYWGLSICSFGVQWNLYTRVSLYAHLGFSGTSILGSLYMLIWGSVEPLYQGLTICSFGFSGTAILGSLYMLIWGLVEPLY